MIIQKHRTQFHYTKRTTILSDSFMQEKWHATFNGESERSDTDKRNRHHRKRESEHEVEDPFCFVIKRTVSRQRFEQLRRIYMFERHAIKNLFIQRSEL